MIPAPLSHFNKKKFFFHGGYYIIRTDEDQPRPKYIFNKCGTNIYFFTLQSFGPSPSPNFKCKICFLLLLAIHVSYAEVEKFIRMYDKGCRMIWL